MDINEAFRIVAARMPGVTSCSGLLGWTRGQLTTAIEAEHADPGAPPTIDAGKWSGACALAGADRYMFWARHEGWEVTKVVEAAGPGVTCAGLRGPAGMFTGDTSEMAEQAMHNPQVLLALLWAKVLEETLNMVLERVNAGLQSEFGQKVLGSSLCQGLLASACPEGRAGLAFCVLPASILGEGGFNPDKVWTHRGSLPDLGPLDGIEQLDKAGADRVVEILGGILIEILGRNTPPGVFCRDGDLALFGLRLPAAFVGTEACGVDWPLVCAAGVYPCDQTVGGVGVTSRQANRLPGKDTDQAPPRLRFILEAATSAIGHFAQARGLYEGLYQKK